MSDSREESVFWEAIEVLRRSCLLPHIMIIGSWAEYLYPCYLGSSYQPNLKTRDVDIYFGNHYQEIPEANTLVNNFRDAGFVLDEYFIDTGRFFKEGIEIEFLSSQMDSGPGMVEIPFTGVMAEKLSSLDMLRPIWIDVREYQIKVPSPASYIAHKLYINPERKPISKRPKDIEAIRSLLFYLDRKPDEIEELRKFLYLLPSEKRERIFKVAAEQGLTLPSSCI